MSTRTYSTAAAVVGASLVALLGSAGGAAAQVTDQGFFCYDSQTDRTVSIGTLANGAADCEGSVSKVFVGSALAGLTGYALVETAVQLCPNLPDGPYQFGPGQPLDYVIGSASGPKTGDTITLDPSSIGVSGVMPVFNVTVANDPSGDLLSVLQADPTLKSQVFDLPGYEALHVTPSSGKGNPQIGMLICDNKIWGRQGAGNPHYGVRRLQLGFTAKDVRILAAGGPSGAGSQANATTLCNAVNSASLEKNVAYVAGSYKTTPTDTSNPMNVTGCVDTSVSPSVQLIPNYCDQTETPGTPSVSRPNSCNPNGEPGGTVLSSDSSTVYGPSSLFCFSGRGSATCF